MASGTSTEMEIKLTNVARAGLEELLADYRDFLRTRGAVIWEKNSREAQFVRKLGLDNNVHISDAKDSRGYVRTAGGRTVKWMS